MPNDGNALLAPELIPLKKFKYLLLISPNPLGSKALLNASENSIARIIKLSVPDCIADIIGVMNLAVNFPPIELLPMKIFSIPFAAVSPN